MRSLSCLAKELIFRNFKTRGCNRRIDKISVLTHLLPSFSLNPDQPSGPWSRWESLTPAGWETNPSQVSSQQLNDCASWVNLGGKEGHTNDETSTELRIKPVIYGWKASILTTAPATQPWTWNRTTNLFPASIAIIERCEGIAVAIIWLYIGFSVNENQ